MAKTAYIGVDGNARKVKAIYVGVNGVAQKVKNAYIGVEGKARQWWEGINTKTKILRKLYTVFTARGLMPKENQDNPDAPEPLVSKIDVIIRLTCWLSEIDYNENKQYTVYEGPLTNYIEYQYPEGAIGLQMYITNVGYDELVFWLQDNENKGPMRKGEERIVSVSDNYGTPLLRSGNEKYLYFGEHPYASYTVDVPFSAMQVPVDDMVANVIMRDISTVGDVRPGVSYMFPDDYTISEEDIGLTLWPHFTSVKVGDKIRKYINNYNRIAPLVSTEQLGGLPFGAIAIQSHNNGEALIDLVRNMDVRTLLSDTETIVTYIASITFLNMQSVYNLDKLKVAIGKDVMELLLFSYDYNGDMIMIRRLPIVGDTSACFDKMYDLTKDQVDAWVHNGLVLALHNNFGEDEPLKAIKFGDIYLYNQDFAMCGNQNLSNLIVGLSIASGNKYPNPMTFEEFQDTRWYMLSNTYKFVNKTVDVSVEVQNRSGGVVELWIDDVESYQELGHVEYVPIYSFKRFGYTSSAKELYPPAKARAEFRAVPKDGYQFVQWKLGDEPIVGELDRPDVFSVTLSGDAKVTAVFEKVNVEHATVTFTPPQGCTLKIYEEGADPILAELALHDKPIIKELTTTSKPLMLVPFCDNYSIPQRFERTYDHGGSNYINYEVHEGIAYRFDPAEHIIEMGSQGGRLAKVSFTTGMFLGKNTSVTFSGKVVAIEKEDGMYYGFGINEKYMLSPDNNTFVDYNEYAKGCYAYGDIVLLSTFGIIGADDAYVQIKSQNMQNALNLQTIIRPEDDLDALLNFETIATRHNLSEYFVEGEIVTITVTNTPPS